MSDDDKVFLGVNDRGLGCWVSPMLIAQRGLREVREVMGLVRRYPVKTDLSGTVVMVEGDSHEDAVNRWLNRTVK
jgi:hypothetical protein